MAVLQIGRLGDRGQCFDHASVDGRQGVFDIAAAHVLNGLNLLPQFLNDPLEQLGIEDGDRFAQRTE